jgi:hypothetical protein
VFVLHLDRIADIEAVRSLKPAIGEMHRALHRHMAETGTATGVEHMSTFMRLVVHSVKQFQLAHARSGAKSNPAAPVVAAESSWSASLNDQDVFNAFFAQYPGALYVLPCEWNVQYHARLNSFVACSAETVKSLLAKRADGTHSGSITANMVSLSCPESERRQIAVCSGKAKILHFMAQTYKVHSDFLQYYSDFWKTYSRLSWNIVLAGRQMA